MMVVWLLEKLSFWRDREIEITLIGSEQNTVSSFETARFSLALMMPTVEYVQSNCFAVLDIQVRQNWHDYYGIFGRESPLCMFTDLIEIKCKQNFIQPE